MKEVVWARSCSRYIVGIVAEAGLVHLIVVSGGEGARDSTGVGCGPVNAPEHVVSDNALGDVEGVLLQVSSGVDVGEEAARDDCVGVGGSAGDVRGETVRKRGACCRETGKGCAIVQDIAADVWDVRGV